MRTLPRGFMTMALMALIVVILFLAIAMGYLIASGALSSGGHLGAMQALFQAESGLEYEQRRWAQNLDWYRSSIDPSPVGAGAVGSGSFTVYSNLPASMLKSGLSAAGATVNAYTTSRYPTSGILQIDDDVTVGGEYVRYTGVSGTTFTGVTRGQTVGTVVTAAGVHVRSDTVYPVTILRTALLANCTALASIQVDANSKFLSAGTLHIQENSPATPEEMSYSSSSTSGGTTTLSGITRCLDSLTPVTPEAHAIGQPVTPVLVGDSSASYQVETISTGTMGSDNRYAKRTIER